jgi:hypothetical protein
LVVSVIVTAGFGGFVLYRTGKEVAYVSAEALKPLKPRYVKSMVVYVPLTPNDRVSYGHYIVKPPAPPKPEDTWAYARRNDG